MTFPEEVTCPVDGCQLRLSFRPRPDTAHYGEVRCPVHGHRWIPKPTEDKKQRRKANIKLLKLIPPHMRLWCWQCSRSRLLLEALKPPLALEIHHIIEVAEGGTDDPENLELLCAECHARVHRIRESHARYQIAPFFPDSLL